MKVDNNIVEYFPSSYCEPLACYFKNLRKYNQSGWAESFYRFILSIVTKKAVQYRYLSRTSAKFSDKLLGLSIIPNALNCYNF